jgi:hypothetical protein
MKMRAAHEWPLQIDTHDIADAPGIRRWPFIDSIHKPQSPTSNKRPSRNLHNVNSNFSLHGCKRPTSSINQSRYACLCLVVVMSQYSLHHKLHHKLHHAISERQNSQKIRVIFMRNPRDNPCKNHIFVDTMCRRLSSCPAN